MSAPFDLSRHYLSGDGIRAGDRVRYGGVLARIVFVLGSDELPSPGVPGRDWYEEELKRGFMLEQDGGGWIFQEETDEDLEFISRAAPEPPTRSPE